MLTRLATATVRTAKRAARVAAAVWRFTKPRCPKWLLPVLAACLFVPGPFDELAVLALVLVPVLRSRDERRELTQAITAAWRQQ